LNEVNFGIWNLVDKGGTLALAFVFLICFIRGWIVPRWAYTELKERCSQLTTLADRATELADRQGIAGEELRRRLRLKEERGWSKDD
jgi:hypothetical protein